MATRMTLPLLGQTMEEGTITKWIKKEGDAVKKGEPIVEVMTDKANMEVEAPEAGILRKIVAAEGATVPVKELIAIIGTADEPIDVLAGAAPAASAPPSAPEPAAVAPAPASEPARPGDGRVFASPRARKAAAERGIDISLLAGKGTGPNGRLVEADVLAFAEQAGVLFRMTPLASKIAADLGVDMSTVSGTGPGGKVMRDDVLRAATPVPPVMPLPERANIGRTIPFSGMRKVIAENMSKSSFTAPHVTLVSEVDMTECTALREQLLPEFEKRYGVKLCYTAIVVKAAALAILDHPIINASLAGNEIVIHDEINIGVATSLDNGLIVPVVKNADAKPLHQISEEIGALADKARAGRLAKDEMSGGTFTISNLATYGVDSFNPVINPPESAILGVCRTVERPAIVDGKVVARRLMNLCLSFDHRVMDGAPAAAYLARVKEILETPYLLFV